MPLVLAVHTVSQVTATIPLSMIMLNDFVKHKNVPEQLKLRLLLPTSGIQSVSLWDVPSIEALQIWLNENLNMDCSSEVFQVQEDFMIGFGFELTRLRTAEKMAQSAKATLDKVNTSTSSIRAELNNMQFQEPLSRVANNETVVAAFDNIQTGVSTGLKKTQAAWSWMSGKVYEQVQKHTGSTTSPHAQSTAGVDSMHSTSSLDGMFSPPMPPPSVSVKPSAPAANPGTGTGGWNEPQGGQQFTVDDDDALSAPLKDTDSPLLELPSKADK